MAGACGPGNTHVRRECASSFLLNTDRIDCLTNQNLYKIHSNSHDWLFIQLEINISVKKFLFATNGNRSIENQDGD